MAGEAVHVEGPYLQRRTENTGTSDAKTAYFFGGPTMWGMGVNDASTIPSKFAAITGTHSENFGEMSYTAHQNLLLLIQLLQAGRRPNLVVFYDGVNDVEKCRRDLDLDAHAFERQFDQTLTMSSKTDRMTYYFAPVTVLAQKINKAIAKSQGIAEYNCNSNPGKAEGVADRLISDWQIAKQLVEHNNGTFLGILQPLAYFSSRRTLLLPADFEQQYQVLYPILRKKIAGVAGFHDFVPVLDGREEAYFDFCHIGPEGNRLVAQTMADVATPLGFKH
jgi:lysophospholipase L1-like esterase